VGVEALGLDISGAAVSWMTIPELVEGVGFVESPAGVRVTMIDGEGDELFGFSVEVKLGTLEEVVAGGCSRNFERMLIASLGETVVVVVVLTELASIVTVTVTGVGPLGLPVDDVEDDVDV